MKARAELGGSRIMISTERPIRLKERIPGAYWSDRRQLWSVPLSMASCLATREVFGDGLEIGRRLWGWAKRERAAAEHFNALAGSTGEQLLLPHCPEVIRQATATRPYQRVGVRFLADSRRALLADQPGLGKTIQTIGAVIESGVPGPYLVAAPSTAVTAVWPGEIERWTEGKHRSMPVVGTRLARQRILDNLAMEAAYGGDAPGWEDVTVRNAWVIVNPEMLRTKVLWVCQRCRDEEYYKELEHTSTDLSAEERSELARVSVENSTVGIWRASDRPRASVIDCGHDPKKARVEVAHEWPELFAREWGAIVVDESHRVLCRTSGRKTLAREGAMRLRLAPNGLRAALSGTPMRGKPHYLFGTLAWLDPDRYRGFTSWKERFFEITSNGFGEVIGGPRQDRLGELRDSLSGLMLRRTKAEVAPDLPPKSYAGSLLPGGVDAGPPGIWLDMEPKQAKAYASMEKSARARIENGEIDALGVLAEYTRLRQFASAYGRYGDDGETFEPAAPSNKLTWIMEALDERGMLDDPIGGSKIVIASQFTSVLEWLAGEISRVSGTDPLQITGRVTGSRRAAAVQEFQYEGGRRILLINTTAGGVAITLDLADEMIVMDETWIPDDQEQLEDRIHRVSRPRPVMYYYLRSRGTVEERIAAGNLTADEIQKRLLDGRKVL